jgi:hypothetical protein
MKRTFNMTLNTNYNVSSKDIIAQQDHDDLGYEFDHDYVEYDEIYPSSNVRGGGGGGKLRQGNKSKGSKQSIYSSKHTRLQAQNRGSNRVR